MVILRKNISLIKHILEKHLIIRSKLFPKSLHLPRLAQQKGGGARAGGGGGGHGCSEKKGAVPAPMAEPWASGAPSGAVRISGQSRPITGAGLDPS